MCDWFSNMLRLAFLLLLWPSIACAQNSAGGWTDPNLLPVLTGGAKLNLNINGLALRIQSVNTGIRNLVLIVAGQSNLSDVAPSAYSPTNASAIDVMNTDNGAVYAAVDPLVGCSLTYSGGNPALRLADNLIIAGKFDRVILVPITVGGSSVADWATGTSANRIPVAMQRLAAKGFTAQTNVTVAIIWGQGETDNSLGTTQGAYTTALNTVIANSVAAGFGGRFFVATQSWQGTSVSAAIQAAQAAVLGGNVKAGPNADVMINATCSGAAQCRQNPDPDGGVNLHWSNAGSITYAAGWQTAMGASGAPF